jgi:hypothetical protein
MHDLYQRSAHGAAQLAIHPVDARASFRGLNAGDPHPSRVHQYSVCEDVMTIEGNV